MIDCVNLRLVLADIVKKKRSLIITLPSTISWKQYEKQLRGTSEDEVSLRFKVHRFPLGINKGDKCYIVYNDKIKGWLKIINFAEKLVTNTFNNKKYFDKFIEQGGEFHYLNEEMPYMGFQGFRYFDLNEYKLQNDINNEHN